MVVSFSIFLLFLEFSKLSKQGKEYTVFMNLQPGMSV